MPKCAFTGCPNSTRYNNSKQIYCSKHLARIKRHGYPELKKDAYRSLEKLPHETVDQLIKKYSSKLSDKRVVTKLQQAGFEEASNWTVKYRRRKLGIKKYLSGEILKHKAWIRSQAIKKYGNKCELCGYGLTLDAHHVQPKHDGGPHEIENLMVLCPNCHALFTRRKLKLKNRNDILETKKEYNKLLEDQNYLP